LFSRIPHSEIIKFFSCIICCFLYRIAYFFSSKEVSFFEYGLLYHGHGTCFARTGEKLEVRVYICHSGLDPESSVFLDSFWSLTRT